MENSDIANLLIDRFTESEEYKYLNINEIKTICGLKGGGDVLFFASLFKEKNESFLIIKENESEAMLLSQSLNFYNIPNYYFPAYDSVPFTKMSPITDIAQERINILYKLINKEKCIIIAAINSMAKKLPNKNDLEKLYIPIKINEKLNLEDLRLKLYDLGYIIEMEVSEIGTAAIRGSIIDIFSIGYDNPIRVEMFDDYIESVRLFKIENGRSFENLEEAIIYPMRETVYNDSMIEEFLKRKDIEAELKNNIIQKKYFAGSENLLSMFYSNLETIFDYFEEKKIFIDDSVKLKNKFINILNSIEENFNGSDNIFRMIGNIGELYIDFDYFDEIIKKSINISPFIIENDAYKFNFIEGESFKSRLTDFLDYIRDYREKDYLIILSTGHFDQADRFYKIMQDLEPTIIVDNINDISVNIKEDNIEENIITDDKKIDLTNNKNNFYIITAPASSGFVKDDIKIIFVADWEVFGRKRKKIKKLPKVGKNIIDTFVDLNVGDYAVHVNYGIGKYLGLTRKYSNGKEKDYLTLEYAEGDKLYIPVEQMNFVQKYISGGGHNPKLTSLRTSAWEKIKSKARADALKTARELIRLYTIRANIRGNVYGHDTQWQDDFEASFKYEETTDQLKAINDIKKDMENGKMMDRLVCGDVGFGKTEVAFRAIFKAIMAGKQCAMLCPTTILSQQHYNTAKNRFKDFPIEIDILNRFSSPKEAKKSRENLKNGECDLIIGTHTLLSKNIEFKNLGLIVIDEEQRFGVNHKEALKKLRLETDVLTLSATPIPRTLNMALTGIRDISVIETPPLNRIPVKTFVMEFNEETVVSAIEREIERKGQVFYLYNRVESIDSFALFVKKLCPKARICIAHGRMLGKRLEKIMKDFIDYKYDILVSTTIIENGIDIPNANTILIENAHALGLSELYQLRGRVGRSDREAYAYMFYPKNLALSEVAYKRLSAISEHTDLGAGFKIAMRDLEIRGAGNILGNEQSGMIYQVGYELYVQMLEEAKNEFNGEIKEVTFDTVIDFKYDLYIPDFYISDNKEKISVYKLILRSQNDSDIESAKEYLTDKYGKIPKVIEDIFEIAKLKVILKRARILSVIEGQSSIYIKLDKYSRIDINKLMRLAASQDSGVYFDKENLNQLILSNIEGTENNLNLKIEKVKNLILEIESHEINIKENKDKSDKEEAEKSANITNIIEANLEAQKIENKKSQAKRKTRKKPLKVIIRKSK